MATDLDGLIRNADPARDLAIPDPDPAAAHADFARGRRRRRSPIPGLVGTGLAVLVAVAVVVIVVAVGGHRMRSVTSAPGVAPARDVVLVQTADTQGGLPWGLELVKASDGQVCLQVDRVSAGRLGAIGAYGAYHDDGRFHPVRRYDQGRVGEPCTTPDANGNVFYGVLAPRVPASAAGYQQRGTAPEDRRTMEYGLLGPDAVSITHVSASGRLITEPTGPGGSYLVVLPATRQICRAGARPCIVLEPGSGTGVISGVIAMVTYRNGDTCRLPATVRTGMCGFRAPGRVLAPFKPVAPTVPRARVAATVTARVLPASYYCQRRNVREATWIPCDHGTPAGYARMPGLSASAPVHQELVQISFTARLAADNHRSYYEMAYTKPCGGGGGNTTQTSILAGQQVVEQPFVSSRCHGRYTGRITYQPKGGAPGQRNIPSSQDGSTLVGRFSFTLP